MNSPFDRDVWAILGMPVDNVTLDEAARLVERAVETRQRLSFVTPNVNWMVRALNDNDAMRQIVNADLSLADGAPVVWLARKLGMPLKERVAGSDLFERLRRDQSSDSLPIRIFFFGGRDGAAKAAHEELTKENGRLVAAGWHNPGFGNVESMSGKETLDKINAAKPDFIIVSLGAAKGQGWIEHNLDGLDAPVIAHLGAVVDFVAGSITRAPTWMSRIGLEWFWRILAEPSLWSRYWTDGRALMRAINMRLKPLRRASESQADDQSFVATPSDASLKLCGAMLKDNRETLRNALKASLETDKDVTLDLSQATSVDAAALGQIRMLQQCQMRRGRSVHIKPSPKIEAALEAANMTL